MKKVNREPALASARRSLWSRSRRICFAVIHVYGLGVIEPVFTKKGRTRRRRQQSTGELPSREQSRTEPRRLRFAHLAARRPSPPARHHLLLGRRRPEREPPSKRPERLRITSRSRRCRLRVAGYCRQAAKAPPPEQVAPKMKAPANLPPRNVSTRIPGYPLPSPPRVRPEGLLKEV